MGVYAEIIEWMKSKEEENTPPTDDLEEIKAKLAAKEKEIEELKKPKDEKKELQDKLAAKEKELAELKKETQEPLKQTEAPTKTTHTAASGLTVDDILKMSVSEIRKHQDIVDEVLQENK